MLVDVDDDELDVELDEVVEDDDHATMIPAAFIRLLSVYFQATSIPAASTLRPIFSQPTTIPAASIRFSGRGVDEDEVVDDELDELTEKDELEELSEFDEDEDVDEEDVDELLDVVVEDVVDELVLVEELLVVEVEEVVELLVVDVEDVVEELDEELPSSSRIILSPDSKSK